MSNKPGMNRRNFLKNSAIGVGAGMLGSSPWLLGQQSPASAPQPTPTPESPLKIKEFRTLGRTGFKVSDISSGFVKDPVVLERLLDAGVNYIDSAESYNNETVVGDVIKKRDRKSLFITTKMELKEGEDISKEACLKRARKSLENLKTDYIDCLMMHGVEKSAMVKSEGFHAAMQLLKNEGRLRFVGISNHGSNWFVDPVETMEKVLTAAALDGRFDVMLLAYNFINEDNGDKVLKLCKEKNIGTTLMKTNPIGNIPVLKERIAKAKADNQEVPEYYPPMITRLEEKAKKAAEFIKQYKLEDYPRMRQAAIRFVLSNPNVNTVCCSFKNFDDIESFITLSGTRLEDMDKEKLSAYKEGCSALYCRHACGLCEPACPHHVPVNSIMRFNHYYEAQGKEKYAMKHYAKLPAAKADLCANCSGHCEKACPYGVPVQGLLYMAHRTLSLA